MATMESVHAREEHGLDALHSFVTSALVFIVDGLPTSNKHGVGHGSGTLLRTPGGLPIVLTAAHVLQEPPTDGFCVGGLPPKTTQHTAVADAIGHRWFHPTADVAIALLSDEAAAAFGHHAPPTTVVAAEDDHEIDEKSQTILCGYPTAYKFNDIDHARRLVLQNYSWISYLTIVNGMDEQGRYEVCWDTGIVIDKEGRHPLVEATTEAVPMKHPGGISGGALWRFRSAAKGEVWVPIKLGKLVGVQSSWDKDHTAFAESVRTWGAWFRTVVSELDNLRR
jgi:hypothetical protein